MSRPLGSRYRIGAPIGRGSLGEVFYGEDDLGDLYAIKVVDPALANPEMVARFVYERNRLIGLRGPNLVEVQDLLVEDEVLAIVAAVVPGGSLRAALAGGPLPPAEVARIGAGVARGLEVLHAAGVVYGAFKPEDVLLDNRDNPPRPRITDFGVAHPGIGGPTGPGSAEPYLAPERWRGAAPAAAADLYSLGIVLYELSCGVVPYVGSSAAVRDGHLECAPGRPAGIPDSLWAVIVELTAREPARRPISAAGVAVRLDGLALLTGGIPAAAALSAPPAPVRMLPPPVEPPPTAETLVVPTVAEAPLPTASYSPQPDPAPAAAYPPAPAAAAAAVPGRVVLPRRSDGRRVVVAAVAALALLAGAGALWAVSRDGDDTSDVLSPPLPVETPLPVDTPSATPTPTETATETPTPTPTRPTCLPFVPATDGGLVASFGRAENFDRCRVDVQMIQKVLGVEPTDGYFGPLTEAAVEAYQYSKCKSYPRFGVIDSWTWDRLIRGEHPRCPYEETPSPVPTSTPTPTFTSTPTSSPSPSGTSSPTESPSESPSGSAEEAAGESVVESESPSPANAATAQSQPAP